MPQKQICEMLAIVRQIRDMPKEHYFERIVEFADELVSHVRKNEGKFLTGWWSRSVAFSLSQENVVQTFLPERGHQSNVEQTDDFPEQRWPEVRPGAEGAS